MKLFISLSVALALSFMWFGLTRPWVAGDKYDTCMPVLWTALEQGGIHSQHFQDLYPNWKTRIASLELNHWWIQQHVITNVEQFKDCCGQYNAFFLFITLLLVIAYCKNPLSIMFAVFAGLASIMAYSSSTQFDDIHIEPFDMPALFFTSLSFFLWQKNQSVGMFYAILIGSLFRESVAVTAVLVFFSPISWRLRLETFISFFVIVFVTHEIIKKVVLDDPSTAVLFLARSSGHYIHALCFWFQQNFAIKWNSIAWSGAGLTWLLLLFKPKTQMQRGILVTLIIYYYLIALTSILDNGAGYENRHFLSILVIIVVYFYEKYEELISKHS